MQFATRSFRRRTLRINTLFPPRVCGAFLWLAALIFAWGPVGMGLAQAEGQFLRFDTPDELVESWRPDVHLYVKGQVGKLGEAELERIAAFLADKHWVVVLIDTFRGGRYDGHRDKEAFEYALGSGIRNKADFNAWAHPETGERDGAFLFISVADKHHNYTGSAAQDSRRLGTKQYPGKLDRWVKTAMRAGLDIQRAVEDSVTNIDQQLNAAIADEIRGAQAQVTSAKTAVSRLQLALEGLTVRYPESRLGPYDIAGMEARITEAERQIARKDYGNARPLLSGVIVDARSASESIDAYEKEAGVAIQAITNAAAAIEELDAAAASLRESAPEVTGDLASPPIAEWEGTLNSARGALATAPKDARVTAQRVLHEAQLQIRSLKQYVVDASLFPTLRERFATEKARPGATGMETRLGQIDTELETAHAYYKQADSRYVGALNTVQRQLDSVRQRITSAEELAALERLVAIVSATLALLITLILFIYLNRRLQGLKKKAERHLATWNSALDAKLDALQEDLEQQTQLYVGSWKHNPYAPDSESALMAESIRDDVGFLSLAWVQLNDQYEKAAKLICPDAFGSRVYNLFWRGNYRAALKLSEQPIELRQDDALNRMVRGKQRTWQESLWGNLSDYRPEAPMTFAELFEAFNRRAERATENLRALEKALTETGPRLDAITVALQELAEKESDFEERAKANGYFAVSALFEELVPAASDSVLEARKGLDKDPIGIERSAAATAQRQQTEATELARIVEQAQLHLMPPIGSRSRALAEAGVEVAWIGVEQRRLSEWAEQIATEAVATTQAGAIAALSDALDTLAARVDKAQGLDSHRRELTLPAISEGRDAIATTRQTIGARLQIEPELTLRDTLQRPEGALDLDPSLRIARSEAMAQVALEALGRGRVADAEGTLDEIDRAIAEVHHILQASTTALDEHEDRVARYGQETDQIAGEVPAHRDVLEGIRQEFAHTVLALQAGDPEHPQANGTIDDNILEAEEQLNMARTKRQQAETQFREGRVLQAANLLEQVAAGNTFAHDRLREIAQKRSRLDRTVAANGATLERLEKELTAIGTEVADGRTMPPTGDAFTAAKSHLTGARGEVDARQGDPFLAANTLADVEEELGRLRVMLQNDRDANAEATRSLHAAERQIQVTRQAADRARNDGYGDSAETQMAYRSLDIVEDTFAQCQETLRTDHSDWNRLDEQADQMASEASAIAATLVQEMDQAALSNAEIHLAAKEVRRASNWTGRYGVYVSGSPGSDELENARALLAQGHYAAAIRAAKSSNAQAQNAIAQAIAQEARKRREEERRKQAERRRRAAAASALNNSISSGSSFGGGSSSSGGSSFGGGSSSSGGSSFGGGSSW